MARSDKIPFRREFTITSSGFLGDANGFYVGDIMSMHINSSVNTTGFSVQGRSSIKHNWETIHKNGELQDLDVRQWEYIRVDAFLLSGVASDTIILFGYDLPRDKDIQITQTVGPDLNYMSDTAQCLKEIREELYRLNRYMEEIVGEPL